MMSSVFRYNTGSSAVLLFTINTAQHNNTAYLLVSYLHYTSVAHAVLIHCYYIYIYIYIYIIFDYNTRAAIISVRLIQVRPPGYFTHTYFYNHACRLRLEKLL
jgi:hypothetical protein